MFYYTYRTTNTVNGKYYLGVHSTKNLGDGYLGSGTVFREALNKYGKANFKCEILAFYNTQVEAYEAEARLVTEDVVKDSNSYNIVLGGKGGVVGSIHYRLPSGKKYLVRPEAVTKFLQVHPDAIEGISEDIIEASRVRNLGKRIMNNGTEHRMVNSDNIPQFLEQGWTLGQTQEVSERNSQSKKGFRVMHKNNKARHVRLEDVDLFLTDGYEFGPPEWMNQKQGQGHKGFVRIHCGDEEKIVPKQDLQQYLDQGYKLGISDSRKSKTAVNEGKITVSKDSQTKMIYPDELEYYLSDGWARGVSLETKAKISRANTSNSEFRGQRSREEAATRRLIYRNSSKFKLWWKLNSSRFNNRPQCGVSHFLEELGMTKQAFLDEMKTLNEI